MDDLRIGIIGAIVIGVVCGCVGALLGMPILISSLGAGALTWLYGNDVGHAVVSMFKGED